MTDEQLDPRDAEVRRLLAGARHTDPAPEDVVARLDRVLADLATEPSRVRPVTDLATRRRRVTRMLVAAAAVVVVGVGVQQVVSPQDGSDSADGPSTTSLREEGGDQDAGSSESGAATSDEVSDDEAPEATESSPLDGVIAPLPQSGEADLVRLRPRHFADDVAAHPTFTNARGAQVGGRAMAFDAAGVACRADAWGRGTFVPVRYGRTPAVLVFRRAMGDTQVADLFLCGETEPERSVTLPAP
jgi:hypothetical protein